MAQKNDEITIEKPMEIIKIDLIKLNGKLKD